MRADAFRADPERVAAFRQLLQSSILADAIVCLKDERPSAAVRQGAEAIESVRVQAKLEQHEADVDILLSLAEPPIIKDKEERPTFGVDKEAIMRQAQPR